MCIDGIDACLTIYHNDVTRFTRCHMLLQDVTCCYMMSHGVT